MRGSSLFSARAGFTLIEALVSVAILGLLATIVTVNLNEAQKTEELNSAARLVAADLRSVQSRALTVKNIRFCQNTSDAWVTCENGTSVCKTGSVCSSLPPDGVGIHFTEASSTYVFYAMVNGSPNNYTMSLPGQVFLTRRMNSSGAANVVVQRLSAKIPATTTADAFFRRQNGEMRLNACIVCGAEPAGLTITLQHTKSGKTKDIRLNSVTGRISID